MVQWRYMAVLAFSAVILGLVATQASRGSLIQAVGAAMTYALFAVLTGCFPIKRVIPVDPGSGGRGMGMPSISLGIAPSNPTSSSQVFTSNQAVTVGPADLTLIASASNYTGMSELTLSFSKNGGTATSVTVTDAIDANGLIGDTLRILGYNGASGQPIVAYLGAGDTVAITVDAYSTYKYKSTITVTLTAGLP